MFVYRVTNKEYKDSILSGVGAEKVGGRWNEVGTRAVYCSENISLALLEYYVHSQNIANLPGEILVAKIKFPDEFLGQFKIEEPKELPERWSQYPYSSKTSSVFTGLAKNPDFFALRAPSTIVAFESNIILNPLYKEFGKVQLFEFLTIPIDERLKKDKRK